jgi:basic membrane protein A
MKKLLSLVLALTVILSLAACGSSAQETATPAATATEAPATSAATASPEATAEPAAELSVAMVCSGSLGDNGIFDMGEAALKQAAADYGIEYKVLEGKQDPSLYYELLNTAASQYSMVFVNPGYQFDSYLEEIADAYPDTLFVYSDGTSSIEKDNIISVSYKEQEGSYLAGVMAAMMTTRTDIKGINEDKVLGFVGAMDMPTINNFLVGFEQGVASVDDTIQVIPMYVGSFNDPATGKEQALSLFDQGADIVYQAASTSGDGVTAAALEKGLYTIGVDTDKSPMAPENVMGSMLKNVTTSFYDVISTKLAGGTLDAVQRKGLDSKWVELYFDDYMKQLLPTDVMEAIDQAQADIISGKIVVEEAS